MFTIKIQNNKYSKFKKIQSFFVHTKKMGEYSTRKCDTEDLCRANERSWPVDRYRIGDENLR